MITSTRETEENKMYIPKYFKPQELVPRSVYEDRGEKSYQLIDDRLLRIADFLRERFGSITVNNWSYGGNRTQSGLRIPGQQYYRPYSQHTFGRALDMIFNERSAQSVRLWLRNNQDFICKNFQITGFTVEENVSWLHIDLRNNRKGYNSIYAPKGK